MAKVLILDSEAVSALARSGRSVERIRAQAILEVAHRMEAVARVPAAALAEVYRGRREDAAVDRVLKRMAKVVPTSQTIAKIAGGLLARNRMDSRNAIDALVVATAARLGGGLIATHDPRDIGRLAQYLPNVKVFAI